MSVQKSFFPLKNTLLFNYKIKARTKIMLAVLYRYKNNEGFVKKTKNELEQLTGIKQPQRYIDELITLGLVTKQKENNTIIYKLNYYVDFGAKESFTKLVYENISKYDAQLLIDYYIIINILKMNKIKDFSRTIKIDPIRFLSTNNDKSPWATIDQINEVFEKINANNMGQFEMTFKPLLDTDMFDDEEEQKEMATEPPVTNNQLSKEQFNNIITKTDEYLNYFHNKTNTQIQNINIERKLVNDFLKKHTLSEAQMTKLLDHMVEQKYNINMFEKAYNNIIFLLESNKQNTAQNLVKYFYQLIETDINFDNIKTFTEKINSVLTKMTFEEAKYLIEFAVNEKDAKTLNYLPNLIDEAKDYIEDCKTNAIHSEEVAKLDMAAKLKLLKEEVIQLDSLIDTTADTNKVELFKVKRQELANQFNELREQYQRIYGGR